MSEPDVSDAEYVISYWLDRAKVAEERLAAVSGRVERAEAERDRYRRFVEMVRDAGGPFSPQADSLLRASDGGKP